MRLLLFQQGRMYGCMQYRVHVEGIAIFVAPWSIDMLVGYSDMYV